VDFEQWLGQVDPRRPINYAFVRDYKEAVKAIWKQTDQGSCTHTHTHTLHLAGWKLQKPHLLLKTSTHKTFLLAPKKPLANNLHTRCLIFES